MNKTYRMGIVKLSSLAEITGLGKKVNDALPGLEIPCLYFDPEVVTHNIVTNEPCGPSPRYIIYQRDLMQALLKIDTSIVRYFEHIGYPPAFNACFGAAPEDVEVLLEPFHIRDVPKEISSNIS